MGSAEWGLAVTTSGMAAVGLLAAWLVRAIWTGQRPRPVPVSVPLMVVVFAGAALATGGSTGEPALVAGVAAYEPTCHGGAATLVEVAPRAERATLSGTADGPCHIWVVIEDPCTGTYWLQGPAKLDERSWSLDVVVGIGDDRADNLPYRLTVFTVTDETSASWDAAALSATQLTLGALPPTQSWLAHDLALQATAPLK